MNVIVYLSQRKSNKKFVGIVDDDSGVHWSWLHVTPDFETQIEALHSVSKWCDDKSYIVTEVIPVQA